MEKTELMLQEQDIEEAVQTEMEFVNVFRRNIKENPRKKALARHKLWLNTIQHEYPMPYPDDLILLVCDGAPWHRSKTLICPENIRLLSIPPYTPEMNPIEQIWKQIRSMGFRNEIFHSLADVVDRLCETICQLTYDMVKSITGRDWIIQCFS